MPKQQKLDRGALAEAMSELPDWRLDETGSSISRSLTFKTFNAAFSFMTSVALEAERQDHHPDWSNSYKKVDIRLTSHDAKGVTIRDIRLAKAIDALV